MLQESLLQRADDPVSEVLRAALSARPNDLAVVDGDQHWTWQQLGERVAGAAALLRQSGVRADRPVLVVARNGVVHVVALFACRQLGAVYVPVNWRLAEPELADLAQDAQCAAILVDEEFAGAAGRIGPSVGDGAAVLTTTAILDAPAPGGAPDGEPVERPVSADARLVQMYTSGTTGRIKGAMYSAGNLRVVTERHAAAWNIGPDDVSLACMPLFHIGGLAWVLASLSIGAPVVLAREFNPVDILDSCEREHITTTLFVPAMVSALLDVIEQTGRRPALRRITCSGAPMPPALITRAQSVLDVDLYQVYGLTEATGALTQLDPPDHRGDQILSVGRPYPWIELKVVDPATGDELPPGVDGEVWTRSEQVFLGYRGLPEETSAALTEDGWLRTGDIGVVDADGLLYLRDRRKDMVISGGENVYPAEVEKVLAAYEPVLEVAVIGVPSQRWGETVKAIVVPRPGRVIDPADLIAFTRTRLAAFKCPTSVDVVDVLPRTASGKIRKDILREPFWAGRSRNIG